MSAYTLVPAAPPVDADVRLRTAVGSATHLLAEICDRAPARASLSLIADPPGRAALHESLGFRDVAPSLGMVIPEDRAPARRGHVPGGGAGVAGQPQESQMPVAGRLM